MNDRIVNFTDLIAWKEGHKLVLGIYEITGNFPHKETFILSSQIQRSAISITSNLAEGFSRKGKKEKIQFYCTSLASLTELQNQLYIARDLEYINRVKFDELYQQSILIHKLTNGLIKSAQNRM